MQNLQAWLRNYFGITQKEANGFIVLNVLILFLLTIPWFFKQTLSYITPPPTYEEEFALLDSLTQHFDTTKSNISAQASFAPSQPHISVSKSTPVPTELFAFNPNFSSVDELKKLGFSNKIAHRVINYRSKGGKFHIKSDLKKIYGLPDALYRQVESYVQLPSKHSYAVQTKATESITSKDSIPNKHSTFSKVKKKSIQPFDINTADTTTFKQIRGIGSKLSARIVKFRNKLGGFYAITQLSEVWGIRPEVYQELAKYAQITSPSHQYIQINQVEQDKLSAHPYVNYSMSKIMIAYRKQHGNYENIAALKAVVGIDQEQLQKLAPYLDFTSHQ